MKAKLIAINIPAVNTSAGTGFYGSLLGLEMARALSDDVESYHVPTRDGQFLWLTPPRHESDSAPVPYFAVENLAAMVKDLLAQGGKLIGDIIPMPMSQVTKKEYAARLREMYVEDEVTDNWGSVQLMRDPNGMLIGLVEIEPHAHVFYGIGKHGSMRIGPAALEEHRRSLELGKKIG